ncbi:MAG: DUF6879 family protein [Pseudonocardiales bacterium]
MTLTELFETFRESAFRLEALQHYVLEEDEPRRQAFRAGRPLPPRPGKIESMRVVRDAVVAGKRVHRVHVVELPLTEYLRYELAVYPENIAAGEDVRIADRAAHRGLKELDTDFWLFDAEAERPAVVWFRYTADGRIVGRDYSDDPQDVRRARTQRDLAVAHSLSLDEFLALPGVR